MRTASTRATCSSTEATWRWICARCSTAGNRGWQEADLDLPALAAALEGEAPFLAPSGELRVVGYGFYSRVLETASGWIVRVARTPDAAVRHAMECRVLPELAPQLGVVIPTPRLALAPSELTPFGAIAYRRLPGRLMLQEETVQGDWRTLARDLGREVARLHGASLEDDSTTPAVFDPDDFRELRAVISVSLRRRLTSAEWARVDAWWERFEADESLLDCQPVLTHGDIWWGNLLVEDRRLSGILDWEFLSLGDPAWDLGTMRQMGDAFLEEAVREYLRHRDLDAGWEHRARQWWALRAFFGVRFAVDREDEGEWSDSLRKLRNGPILA